MERNMDRKYPGRRNEDYQRNVARFSRDEERSPGYLQEYELNRRQESQSREQHDWNRNSDNSRRDIQRDETQRHSFGFSDHYEGGPAEYSGPFDTNHTEDLRQERGFRPMHGNFTQPVMRNDQEAGSRREASSDRETEANRELNYRTGRSYPRTSSFYGYGLGDGNYHDTYYGRPSEWNRYRGEENQWWEHEAHARAHREGGNLWKSVKSFFGVGPKGYKRSDERILEDVCERLARHPGIDASEIEVQVEEGHVTLKGQVDSRFNKRRAEDVIESLPGLVDIRNELTLRQNHAPGVKARNDYTLGVGTNLYNGGSEESSRETAAMGSSGSSGTMGSVVNAGTHESEGVPRKNLQ